MRILITNDDGFYSPGIAFLARVAQQFGKVLIVAPDVEQSSMGHAITHARPLSIKKASSLNLGDIESFRVNGTPADCVALGTHLYHDFDLVLSGINMGFNLGNSIWHSGTLAAAKHAVLLGIKGIAFSTSSTTEEPDFTALKPWLSETLELLIKSDLGLFNVNLPFAPKGIQWTRQSVRYYDGKIVPYMDPMGRKYYWPTVIPLDPAEAGTDRWAVDHGYVSITPLRLDLTDEVVLKKLAEVYQH